jgi:dTDP-4-amino-4,6-dideoxygalactose transaminase
VNRTIKFLSLHWQQHLLSKELQAAFDRALENAHYVLGADLENFEQQFARYNGVNYCVGTGSGLDALTIALKSLKLTAEEEVIVPANTYHATWLAVANAGVKIVPVEPDEHTYNLDPDKLKNALTKKTKVLLPVHLYGQACNMDALMQIALDYNLKVVEDNAQAHGASWNGRKTGSWGVVNATSFYPTKNLGALGDGGAITTNNLDIASFAKMFRNYGSASKNVVETLGVNSRLDNLQAAILNVKLAHLDRLNAERRLLAAKYTEQLKHLSQVSVPAVHDSAVHVFHLYVIKAENRDQLKDYLAEKGIETMIHYPVPPHLQKPYSSLIGAGKNFPITERLAKSILSLPLWPGMTDDEISYVTETIADFYR